MREGVEIEPEKPKAETVSDISVNETAEEPKADTIASQNESAQPQASISTAADEAEGEDLFDETDIPGADDPASFVNFLTTIASQAAAALGAVPHPATGQRQVDLETGKYWIDVLAMLEERTKGNLHPQEARLTEGLLADLRMQFVQISRMAEEKLKQQAAQKFSANDILGKK